MDGEMNDIFQKLNTALEDPSMSNNLKNILNNLSSSNTPNNTNSDSSSQKAQSTENNKGTNSNFKEDPSQNSDTRKSGSGIPEFDLNTILKIKKIMDSMNNNENDSRANLLLSLKPYLSDYKKDKVDQYVKFLRFAKVFETLNPMGGDSINNE